MTVLNIFRTLALSLAGVVCVLSAGVAYFYGRIWVRNRKAGGILPLHVFMIATSHCVLTVHSAAFIAHRYDKSLNWETPVFMVAMVFSITALVVVAKYEQKRFHLLPISERVRHDRRSTDRPAQG